MWSTHTHESSVCASSIIAASEMWPRAFRWRSERSQCALGPCNCCVLQHHLLLARVHAFFFLSRIVSTLIRYFPMRTMRITQHNKREEKKYHYKVHKTHRCHRRACVRAFYAVDTSATATATASGHRSIRSCRPLLWFRAAIYRYIPDCCLFGNRSVGIHF